MKRILSLLIVSVLCLGLLSACSDDGSDHEHSFSGGKCQCGATDPSYVKPHEHSFVDGVCNCGEEDPDYIPPHEHIFVDGKCSGCGATDPNFKPDYGDATVFAAGDTVQFIGSSVDESATALVSALEKMVGSSGEVILGSEYHPMQKLEVLVGVKNNDGERPIIDAAERILERIDRDSIFECRYVVYAEAGKVAIVYDSNEYTALQPFSYVLNEFIDAHFKGKSYFAASKGIIMSGKIDLIRKQEEIDFAKLNEQWDALEAKVGKTAADAFRKLYTLYDDDMVKWAANLYDPGVGAFYSNSSGRDGVEFGPDVECTVQLIKFFVQSGMTENISNEWTEFLPEFMQQRLIYFGKSLQNKNGYFYHPQWTKELVDSHLSRRGRDLGWATSLLTELDAKPPYKAANGKAGDGITADEYWDNLILRGEAIGNRPYPSTSSPVYANGVITKPAVLTASLNAGAADAVSKVILVSEDNPDDPEVDSSTEYLNSYTAFINYLLTKMGPTYDSNPYSMGNTMNATQSQITANSEKLAANGKYVYTPGDELTCSNVATALLQFKVNTDSDSSNDMTLVEIYKAFEGKNLVEMTHMMLVEKINPEIGLWGKTSEKNPTGTEFLFTNGYFKTIGLFSGWGYAYPAEYIPKAANALMQGLLGDQPSTTNICEVFNIWSGIGFLKTNLKYLSDTDFAYDDNGDLVLDGEGNPVLLKDHVKAQVNAILNENMAAAVENSYNKIKGYKKSDGGFDHAYVRTSGGYATQQGCPTGYRLNDQSNVDATCIGSTGLTRTMFAALDLSSYKISLHTESDWMRALEIFYSAAPVIKYSYDEEAASTEIHDYESDIPGNGHLKLTMGSTGNTFTQVKLGDNGVGVLNKTDTGYQAYLDWKPNSVATISNTAVFETKVRFSDLVDAKDRIEMRLYDGTSSSGTRIFSLYFFNDTTKGTVSIAPSTSSDQKVEIAKIGEWFKISLVYCEQTTVGDTVIPACFKVYINDSEKPILVDQKFENGEAVAASAVGFSRFITMKPFVGKIYLDDTRFAREQREIVYDEPTHNITKPGTSTGSGLPNTGCTLPIKDGVMTFDNVTAFPINYSDGMIVSNKSQSKWNGYITAEKEGDNSFLRINDPYRDTSTNGGLADGGQPILLFDRPANKSGDQTFVFEGRFRVSALADGDIKNNSDYYIDLTFRNADGTRVYQTYFGDESIALNSDTKNKVKEVYKTGEWFTLRVEYTVIGDTLDSATWDVKAYINDVLVQENSNPIEEKFDSSGKPSKIFCNSSSIDKVGILLSRGFVGNFDFDDIKIYQKPYVK